MCKFRFRFRCSLSVSIIALISQGNYCTCDWDLREIEKWQKWKQESKLFESLVASHKLSWFVMGCNVVSVVLFIILPTFLCFSNFFIGMCLNYLSSFLHNSIKGGYTCALICISCSPQNNALLLKQFWSLKHITCLPKYILYFWFWSTKNVWYRVRKQKWHWQNSW